MTSLCRRKPLINIDLNIEFEPIMSNPFFKIKITPDVTVGNIR